MLQTLRYKFSADPESIYIFSSIAGTKYESYMRIGTGIIELIAGFLLLFPKTSVPGALLGAGTMSGAIVSHLFILGINVQNDKGFLFLLALTCFVFCSLILLQNRTYLFNFLKAR
jgi:hypothetical protein